MIVVAVVAILAAIALPSYNDYVRRGQLPEAFTHLADYRSKMEQYYQDNKNYGTAAACANNASGTWNTFPTTIKYFTFTCATTNSQQGFVVTATGASGQATGHVYTIDEQGQQGTSKLKGTDVSPAATCWLTKSTSC